MPQYFQSLIKQLVQDKVFPENVIPNHILLNKYKPGDGIMPHKDGPAYYPYVVILSLNSGLFLNFWESTNDAKYSDFL